MDRLKKISKNESGLEYNDGNYYISLHSREAMLNELTVVNTVCDFFTCFSHNWKGHIMSSFNKSPLFENSVEIYHKTHQ
jgi:hypothetical protein